MTGTLRRRIARLAVAAVTLVSVGVAGAASLAPHSAAAAPSNLFKADLSVTAAFQVPVNGAVFYYFKLSNTGIDSGAVKAPSYTCGVRYHFVGETTIHYRYDYGLYLGSTFTVNAGQTRYLVARCNPESPEDTIVGVNLSGELDNNIGASTFSVTVGYVP